MRIPLVIRARCRKPVYNVVLFRGSPFKGILIVPREIGAAIGDPSRPLENPRVRDRVYGRGWLIERGRVEEREGKREREGERGNACRRGAWKGDAIGHVKQACR